MIDIRSDTVTRPSRAMRDAIANAEVGDDYLDGDPTTRRLEARVAELLGKEKGLFFPSGTMANQTAIWTLSEPGTEVYADLNSHIVDWEMVAAAVIAGVQVRTVQGDGPMMDASSLERTFRPPSPSAPRASLVCLENTHNGAGGLVTPLAGWRTRPSRMESPRDAREKGRFFSGPRAMAASWTMQISTATRTAFTPQRSAW